MVFIFVRNLFAEGKGFVGVIVFKKVFHFLYPWNFQVHLLRSILYSQHSKVPGKMENETRPSWFPALNLIVEHHNPICGLRMPDK